MNVSRIDPLAYDDCSPYDGDWTPWEHDVQLELRGTVLHGERPAPDIGYDYRLELAEPYLDELSATGAPERMTVMDASPVTNEV